MILPRGRHATFALRCRLAALARAAIWRRRRTAQRAGRLGRAASPRRQASLNAVAAINSAMTGASQAAGTTSAASAKFEQFLAGVVHLVGGRVAAVSVAHLTR
jgi:hypothetical protein